jgi:integrase
VVLLYRGGLRCGEAVQLDVADFDPDIRTVRVRQGKATKRTRRGGRRKHVARTVALDPEASDLVAAWVTKRPSCSAAPAPALHTGREAALDELRPRLGLAAGEAGGHRPPGASECAAAHLRL